MNFKGCGAHIAVPPTTYQEILNMSFRRDFPVVTLAGLVAVSAAVPSHDQGHVSDSDQTKLYVPWPQHLWDNSPESSGGKPLPYVVGAAVTTSATTSVT